jgi:RHS repeat-associated protein
MVSLFAGQLRIFLHVSPLPPIIPALTNRGFTGYEHIDEVGLIHMNGRVYDPQIGRFLSTDPYIQHKQQTSER